MIFQAYQSAARLCFSGRISVQLWALIVGLNVAFAVYLRFVPFDESVAEPAGQATFLIFASLMLWLVLALWVGWRLSRALTVGEDMTGGSFGGWFKWSILAGIPGMLVTGIYEIIAGDNVEWWLSALLGAIVGAMVLPAMIHTLVRAANDRYVPSAWTFRNGQSFFYPLVSASLLWVVPVGLLNGYFIELAVSANGGYIGIMSACGVAILMIASMVIQGGLAAVGYHNLPPFEIRTPA
jgi:hypothetical protein